MRVLSANIKSKTAVFTLGLILAFVGLAASSVLTVHKVSADDPNNNIMYGGTGSPSAFISKVRANSDGHGHHDLQAIYAHYGLSTSDYSNFAKNAVEGRAYQDGRIVVGGQTVATAGKSIGRIRALQGSGPFSVPIAGNTYYGNDNQQAFASGSLPVYVMFNSQGVMQFAVITNCGNPEFGSPSPSSASCRELTKTPVAGELNTYSFTATANVSGNARVNKYVIDYGDGTSKVVSTSATSVTVSHHYTKAGTFTAKVTEFASVPGNDNLQLPVVSMCTKTITVVLPFYSCAALTPTTVDESKFIYKFTATAANGNGAVFKSTDYNFGDNTAVQTVQTTNGKNTVVTHQFAKNGDYNISALLHFTVNGKAATASYRCTASTKASTCKPGIPVGDVRCNPCLTNPAVSAEDTQNCVTEAAATTLPNTGAGNTIAIFAAVVVAGFLGYRHILFRKHRAAFLAAQQGTSPLPLGDPLNDTAPLRDTPLAPKRRSFRRNRPF